MNLQKDDYQQRRQVFEFCGWIHEKLIQLSQEPDFEELYFERKGDFLKKLIEEAIPVSYFGLFLSREWNEVFIQCFTDIPHYDAIVEIQNPLRILKETIKVEVTSTEDNPNVMRRQALARDGFAHLTGTVKREGRNIKTEGEFVETEEESEKVIQLALEGLERKLKNAYDNQTAILIYVTGFRQLAHHHRFKLIEETKRLLREKKPTLYGVFFCYSSNRGVDGIILNQMFFSP